MTLLALLGSRFRVRVGLNLLGHLEKPLLALLIERRLLLGFPLRHGANPLERQRFLLLRVLRVHQVLSLPGLAVVQLFEVFVQGVALLGMKQRRRLGSARLAAGGDGVGVGARLLRALFEDLGHVPLETLDFLPDILLSQSLERVLLGLELSVEPIFFGKVLGHFASHIVDPGSKRLQLFPSIGQLRLELVELPVARRLLFLDDLDIPLQVLLVFCAAAAAEQGAVPGRAG